MTNNSNNDYVMPPKQESKKVYVTPPKQESHQIQAENIEKRSFIKESSKKTRVLLFIVALIFGLVMTYKAVSNIADTIINYMSLNLTISQDIASYIIGIPLLAIYVTFYWWLGGDKLYLFRSIKFTRKTYGEPTVIGVIIVASICVLVFAWVVAVIVALYVAYKGLTNK